jgi:hypothetical protein
MAKLSLMALACIRSCTEANVRFDPSVEGFLQGEGKAGVLYSLIC